MANRLFGCWLAPILAGLALLGTAGCGPLSLLDAITPAGAYRPRLRIAYGRIRASGSMSTCQTEALAHGR